MSRTVLAKVEGFTPVIDSVVKDTGSYMTALVFGRIWRYCQMKDGVCNATLETIAYGLEMSRTTVMNHAKKLVELGYLEDRSPNLRNHPHTYVDTGKAGLQVGVSTNSHVNLVDEDVNVMDTHVNVADLKIDSNKEINKDSTTAAIFKTYENEIYSITPIVAEKIGYWIDDPKIPNEWIIEAIKMSSIHGARNWAYAEAILKRWAVEGKAPLKQPMRKDKRQAQIEKLRAL